MTAKRRLGTTGYYVVSILIAVVAMIPFLWMISTSLKSLGALMSIPIEWIPAEPSLDAYGEVFSRFPFLKTIGNSLFISVSYCSATSFLRNWDSILEKKRANLRSISEPARLRQPPPPEARERHTQEGGLKAYGRSDE